MSLFNWIFGNRDECVEMDVVPDTSEIDAYNEQVRRDCEARNEELRAEVWRCNLWTKNGELLGHFDKHGYARIDVWASFHSKRDTFWEYSGHREISRTMSSEPAFLEITTPTGITQNIRFSLIARYEIIKLPTQEQP